MTFLLIHNHKCKAISGAFRVYQLFVIGIHRKLLYALKLAMEVVFYAIILMPKYEDFIKSC